MTAPVVIAQARLRLEDPHDCTDANDVLTLFDAFFDGLVRRTQDNVYEPALAERWTVDEEAREWVFTIRQGVTFHDGTPLDANAVVASLQRMSRADKGYTLGAPGVYHQYLGEAAIEAPDRLTVTIRLPRPMADLLDVLVYGYVVAPDCFRALESGDCSRPVGTGPYRFQSFKPDSTLHAVRNEAYFGPAAANAELVWHLEPDPAARQALLVSGQAQVANGLDFHGSRTLPDDRFTRLEYLSPVAIIYLLNAAGGVLADGRLRRALSLAVDRRRIIGEVLGGAARPLDGYLSPLHFGAVSGGHAPVDVVKARRLVAEAGFADGLILKVDCPTRLPDEAQALTRALADELDAIGVKLEVRLHADREAYAHQVRRKEIGDLCVFDSSPMSAFRVLHEKIDSRVHGSWWQGYANPAVEVLIDRGRATADDAARESVYQEAYGLLQQDPAWLCLYNPIRVIALSGDHAAWSMRRDGVLDVARLPRLER